MTSKRSPKPKASKITDPALVEVTPELEAWAASRWGAAKLPQQYLSEFKDHHAARPVKFADAVQAFRNWINWSGPAGRFYRADVWEQRLRAARRIELNTPRSTRPPDMVAGQYVVNGKAVAEAPIMARASSAVVNDAIAAMRSRLA